MEVLLFLAIFGGLLALVIFSLYQRARQVHALLNEGIPVQGTVTRLRRFSQKGRARFAVHYQYSPDGQLRKGRSFVPKEQFEALTEGQLLALRYLADKPSVSAPEFVLERARQEKR